MCILRKSIHLGSSGCLGSVVGARSSQSLKLGYVSRLTDFEPRLREMYLCQEFINSGFPDIQALASCGCDSQNKVSGPQGLS